VLSSDISLCSAVRGVIVRQWVAQPLPVVLRVVVGVFLVFERDYVRVLSVSGEDQCSGEQLWELQNFLLLFVLKLCFVRILLGKKGLFGCSNWWKSLFQCTGKLISVWGLSYSGLVLEGLAVW
jgi:hypothetical protein